MDGLNIQTKPKRGNKMEIKSVKLANILSDINNAYYALTDVENHSKPQELIRNAKVLEIGEKKLKKQFLIHIRDIEQLQYQLEIIKENAEKFGYDFAKADESEDDDNDEDED